MKRRCKTHCAVILVLVAIFANLGLRPMVEAAPRVVPISVLKCHEPGTYRQLALYVGYSAILFGADIDLTHGDGSIKIGDGDWLISDLQAMSYSDRAKLALQFVKDSGGVSELKDYLKLCNESDSVLNGDFSEPGVETPIAAEGSIATSTLDQDARCKEWAEVRLSYWGQFGLKPIDLEKLSNCNVDSSGRWFMATGPNDPRLIGGPILSNDEAEATKRVRADLTKNVNDLLAWAATQPARSVPGSQAGSRSFGDELKGVYSSTLLPVTGHVTDARADYDFYWNQLVAMALDPNNVTLNLYLTWELGRAASIQTRICTSIASIYDRQACNNMLAEPALYPGRLLDEMELAGFSKWILQNS